jgi:hypothetical protein
MSAMPISMASWMKKSTWDSLKALGSEVRRIKWYIYNVHFMASNKLD